MYITNTAKKSNSADLLSQTAIAEDLVVPLPNRESTVPHEVEDVAGQLIEAAGKHICARAPDAVQLWKGLPREEQGVLSHLAKSAEEFCTPDHLAKLGKSAKAIGSLIAKGVIAQTPLGALQILDPLLKQFVAESSMHLEASGSITEGGPKTFQFNFGMSANMKKLQPSH